MRIDGLFEIKNAGMKFAPPWKITVLIGEPLRFSAEASAEEIASRLQCAVSDL
jgi:hypothetical protein